MNAVEIEEAVSELAATIADLYDPDEMPDDLRAAHVRNDETLERIYIGRRFCNDTERLEKLSHLYTKIDKAPKKPGGRDVVRPVATPTPPLKICIESDMSLI